MSENNILSVLHVFGLYYIHYIGCSFKFLLKVGAERTTDYGLRISCLNLTSLFALFVFLLSRLTSGAIPIDSSMPTLRRNLNEHPILQTIKNGFEIEQLKHFNLKPKEILRLYKNTKQLIF
jgi:hypothetical protein